MARFRKKPVTVDALTFNEVLALWRAKPEGVFFVNGYMVRPSKAESGVPVEFSVHTLEGTMTFAPHDMLIIGVKGEVYPCKADIFEQTYDAVDA